VSRRALLPIAVGGLAYSVGAVLNLLRWPALWAGVFGTHELFHLFVLAGSLAHYWFMLKVIVPFVRKPRADPRGPSPRTTGTVLPAWVVPGRTRSIALQSVGRSGRISVWINGPRRSNGSIDAPGSSRIGEARREGNEP
jgi:hypothetical protein